MSTFECPEAVTTDTDHPNLLCTLSFYIVILDLTGPAVRWSACVSLVRSLASFYNNKAEDKTLDR